MRQRACWRIVALVVALPESYTDAREQRLTTRGALQAVLNYATDFIARGDIDVLFTISGGAMDLDGQSADPAVWADWLAAWRAVGTSDQSAGIENLPIDVQRGYRGLLVFLESDYEPIAETPMSRVRDDCIAALSGRPEGARTWERWKVAIESGDTADIAFRLTKPTNPPTAQ